MLATNSTKRAFRNAPFSASLSSNLVAVRLQRRNEPSCDLRRCVMASPDLAHQSRRTNGHRARSKIPSRSLLATIVFLRLLLAKPLITNMQSDQNDNLLCRTPAQLESDSRCQEFCPSHRLNLTLQDPSPAAQCVQRAP